MSRFLQCPDCHGIALVIYGEEDAGCGIYDKLHANTTDAALEKHLPVVEVKKDVVQAKVGADDHPMDEDHYITWVYLETTRAVSYTHLMPTLTESDRKNIREAVSYGITGVMLPFVPVSYTHLDRYVCDHRI